MKARRRRRSPASSTHSLRLEPNPRPFAAGSNAGCPLSRGRHFCRSGGSLSSRDADLSRRVGRNPAAPPRATAGGRVTLATAKPLVEFLDDGVRVALELLGAVLRELGHRGLGRVPVAGAILVEVGRSARQPPQRIPEHGGGLCHSGFGWSNGAGVAKIRAQLRATTPSSLSGAR